MKTKRLSAIFSATVIGVSTILSAGLMPLAGATSGSDTCTWTGATNLNWSTAGNWSGCSSAAPVNGDNLVFDATSLTASKTLNNDISSLAVGTITFQGGNSNSYSYTLNGNGVTVNGAMSDTGSAGAAVGLDFTLGTNVAVNAGTSYISFTKTSSTQVLNLNGHNVTASGSVNFDTFSGTGNLAANGSTTYIGFEHASSGWTSGSISLGGSASLAANDSHSFGAATINVNEGSNLMFCGLNGATINNTLNIGGRGSSYTANGATNYFGAIVLVPMCQGGGGNNAFDTHASLTWAGPINLSSNTTVSGQGELTVTGALHGNFTLTEEPGQSGKITINSSDNQSASGNGTQTSQTVTTTYSGNQPNTYVSAGTNNIAIVDGTYGDSEVSGGGILKGTGTVNSLTANSGGIVAPGHSPGTLTVKTLLTLNAGSTYQTELKDTAAGDFDQLVVGAAIDTDNTAPDVTLGDTNGSPTLTVSLYDGYKINKGDQFMIINNLSKTDVKGTFANLPEGATFKVGTAVFAITYKGGDGNDLVLTAQNTPTTPDTGFGMVAAHPGATLGLTVLVAGGIMIMARRSRLAPARAKVATTRRRK